MWTELTNLGPYVIIFWAAHFVSTTQCVKGEKKEGYLFNAQLAGSWQQISLLLLHKVGKVRSWSPATTGFMWIEKDFRVQYSLAAAAALPCKIDAMILLPILLKNSSLDPDIWLFCRTHLKKGGRFDQDLLLLNDGDAEKMLYGAKYLRCLSKACISRENHSDLDGNR